MFAHRIETTISQDGLLMLKTLPFHQGERVEVIILSQQQKTSLPARKVFLPFNAIKMRGEGPTATEMVIQDRS